MKLKPISWSWQWRSYRFAFLAVAIATGCVGLLMLLIALPAFIIYIAVISAITNYGGISSGIIAATLSFLFSIFLFIPPYFSLNSDRPTWSLLLFYMGSVFLSVIITKYIKVKLGT